MCEAKSKVPLSRSRFPSTQKILALVPQLREILLAIRASGAASCTLPDRAPASELVLVKPADRAQAAPQELAFRLVGSPGDRGLIGGRGLSIPAEPAEQIGADRVEEVVAVQVRGQVVHHHERGRRPVDFGQRDGAVERDDGAGTYGEQLVVELQYLRPVGTSDRPGVGMNRVDRCLNLIWPWLSAPQTAADDGLAFGYQVAIPDRTILVAEQHQPAVGTDPRGPAQPVSHGRFRHQECPGDLGGTEPAEQSQRQRYL